MYKSVGVCIKVCVVRLVDFISYFIVGRGTKPGILHASFVNLRSFCRKIMVVQ